jgi:hypothetical protein
MYHFVDVRCHRRFLMWWTYSIVTDLINALPGNSSVNTVQHATIEEALFSVHPTDASIDWLDSGHVTCVCCMSVQRAPVDWLVSDHVICIYCRPMSVPLLHK